MDAKKPDWLGGAEIEIATGKVELGYNGVFTYPSLTVFNCHTRTQIEELIAALQSILMVDDAELANAAKENELPAMMDYIPAQS